MILIGRRIWAFRLSIVLSICAVLYFCAYFGTSGPWIDDGTTAAAVSNLEQIKSDLTQHQTTFTSKNNSKKTNSIKPTSATGLASSILLLPSAPLVSSLSSSDLKKLEEKEKSKNTSHVGVEFQDAQDKKLSQSSSITLSTQQSKNNSLKDIIKCNEKTLEPKMAQRGDYWVLYNYVPMSLKIQCWESVTYTTHADFTFLDNLEPLLKRWQAPVSIALHTPGTDFQPTLDSIKYLRSCKSSLISKFTTFHIYFHSKHIPKVVPSSKKVMEAEPYNCSLGPPWTNNNYINNKMYKNKEKLLYPVNVGRNIARESAITHYVLASDIELYPNPPNLPIKFLEMIRRNDDPLLLSKHHKVFVLPIFEVEKNSEPPLNKTALVKMLKARKAVPFHERLCSICHNIPKSKEWQEARVLNDDIHVFFCGKRTGSFAHWEPIFIGTNNDPLYDERLTWEGKSDKMTQGYALCVLDYDFLILDNAFLVHRPGIKRYKKDPRRDTLTEKTNMIIRKIIMPELKIMYGLRKGCVI
ncbi:beta-1,4-glucuronyltransferase 1-like [Chelonus insularis]|uniref:beta-1,4-glucuronyltransferase 1-like n=1 Tax=Chelonus insularis TaxID=460826 RepID=UPI00158B219A|nr:beta-1,4-glucuronyltransferase 1-like [Chelonus insularis]XP_034944158.1 beta-1,4-glucuronyltransferase 1-like [Chelonus insularis]XP_034944168.1 beta-1,4-glucuronyltransferase 1-like [Chelonus insularis]XP_034944178.1 beta-1,4-glucuronyltransferase 1-like [Chelonus insularis]XP_034944186.1 beta-1,4-glucuronyltransferase 1-like [Chelonus insularis]